MLCRDRLFSFNRQPQAYATAFVYTEHAGAYGYRLNEEVNEPEIEKLCCPVQFPG